MTKPETDWVLVRRQPTEEQWGGLARDIMMWLDMGDGRTPRALFKHLERLGRDIPQWLRDEPEMKYLDHVPSKGTRVAIIYKAMLAAAPSVLLTETALVKEWEDVRRDDRGFPEGHPDYLRELEERGDRMAAALTAQAAALQEARMQALSDEGQARELSARATTAEAALETARVALGALFPEPVKNADGSWTTERADLELEGALEDVRRGKADKIVADTLTRVLIKLNTALAALPLPALPKTKGADHD